MTEQKPEQPVVPLDETAVHERAVVGFRASLHRRMHDHKESVKATAARVRPRTLAIQTVAAVKHKDRQIHHRVRQEKIKHQVDKLTAEQRPEPKSARAELDGIVAVLDVKSTLVEILVVNFGALMKLELISGSSGGAKVQAAAEKLADLSADLRKWLAKAQAVRGRFAGTAEAEIGPALWTDYEIAWREAKEEIAEAVDQMTKAQVRCATALNYEAIRAIVTDPDHPDEHRHQDIAETVEKILSQALSAVDEVGSKVGEVPEPHAKSAALGIHIATSVLNAMKIGFSHAAGSIAVRKDIRDYLAKNTLGIQFDEHDKDPLLIAKFLGRRRIAHIKLVLDLVADPIVKELDVLCPVPTLVGHLWKGIRSVVEGSAESYEKKRVEVAEGSAEQIRSLRDMTPQNGAALLDGLRVEGLTLGRSALDQLQGEIENNLASVVLHPVGILVDSAVATVAKRIAEMVISAVPVDPAQEVTGAQLYDHLEGVLGVLHRVVQVQPAPAVDAGPTCPTRTGEHIGVALVLSGAEGEPDAPTWLVRLRNGTVGRLGADKSFTAVESPPALPPTTATVGSNGPTVRVTRVDVTTPVPAPSGSEGSTTTEDTARSYRAWVGSVRGTLTEGAESSWTFAVDRDAPVDQAAFVNWADRFIYAKGEKIGYHDTSTGEFVPGRWYRPLPERHYYLFLAQDGTVEWAQGVESAANEPLAHVEDVLVQADQTPLEELLPRLS